jgi:hypothetical protein
MKLIILFGVFRSYGIFRAMAVHCIALFIMALITPVQRWFAKTFLLLWRKVRGSEHQTTMIEQKAVVVIMPLFISVQAVVMATLQKLRYLTTSMFITSRVKRHI